MNQSQNNNNIGTLSNLKINTDIIIFSRQSFSAEIILSNLHQKYSLYFKIKTKIEKLFDVKPCLGFIKPGEQQKITFKRLKEFKQEQIPGLQQTLLFLLQVVNQLNPQLTKQEEQAMWKDIKTKKTIAQLGYCSVKLGVTFSSKKQKEMIPFFNNVQSKPESRYISEVGKSIKPVSASNFAVSNSKLSSNSQQGLNDVQLSKKYEELKEKEDKLIKQRQRMFQGPSSSKKAKGPSPVKRRFNSIQFWRSQQLLFYWETTQDQLKKRKRYKKNQQKKDSLTGFPDFKNNAQLSYFKTLFNLTPQRFVSFFSQMKDDVKFIPNQQFYKLGSMRSTVQKQKVSSALKNMTQVYKQQSIEAIKLKQEKMSSMSFVNLAQSNNEEKRKTDHKQHANPFSTFIVPYTKHQSKILKSLMLNSKGSEKKQICQTKSKSERVRNFYFKNSSNQCLKRKKSDFAFLKRVQEQAKERMLQIKNKKNSTDKIQLENLKKISQNNLIENIESFIKLQQSQNENELNFIQVVSQNQRSKTQQSCLPESTFQLIQNYNRWKRQVETNKFKETVKNKLSRKHIYRVLKQKSQISKKIKPKTRSFSNNKQLLEPTGFGQAERVIPVHCGLTKTSLKHLYLSTFKHHSLPFFQNQQQLKIQAKAAELSNYFSLNSKDQFLTKAQLSGVQGKSLGIQSKQQTNPETQNKFQLRKQQMSDNDRNLMIKRWKSTRGGKYNANQNTTEQGSNIFRELTPWHGDYPE